MKVIETKTIPAVPEQTIPAQPERMETVEKTICDVCKKHLMHCWCAICERELCDVCRRYDPTSSGDHSGAWCRHCLRLWHERYDIQLQELETEYEDKDSQLRAKWKAESLAIDETEEPTQ